MDVLVQVTDLELGVAFPSEGSHKPLDVHGDLILPKMPPPALPMPDAILDDASAILRDVPVFTLLFVW